MAMSSYEWMFNACRIPAKPCDYPVKYNYKEHPYIVVVRKNQFFKVYHEYGGKQLNTSELEQQFRRIYANAEKAPPVGFLTSQHRDAWTYAREHLLAASPSNKAVLSKHVHSSSALTMPLPSPSTNAHASIGMATVQTAGSISRYSS